jgi:hypothetical protein
LRTSAAIVFAAFFLALADDAISAPQIGQANKLAFALADSPQCAVPDVDDDEGNTLLVDQLNDISDSASNRVYLKEESSEELLIGSLAGISCRRAEARGPPGNDRRNSSCLISSLTSSLPGTLPQIFMSGLSPFHHPTES